MSRTHVQMIQEKEAVKEGWVDWGEDVTGLAMI